MHVAPKRHKVDSLTYISIPLQRNAARCAIGWSLMKHATNSQDTAAHLSYGSPIQSQRVSEPSRRIGAATTLPDGFPAVTDPYEDSQRNALVHLNPIAGEQAVAATEITPRSTGNPAVAEAESGMPHRHRRADADDPSFVARHGTRLASFSIIGATVFFLGLAIQWALVHVHAGAYGSYAGQAAVSIQASWLLNRRFTWGDREVSAQGSLLKWNVQRWAATIPNLALYALMIHFDTGWLVANVATTAVFTVVNYVMGDRWSFATATYLRSLPALPTDIPPLPDGPLPSVSIVIPVKSSERTIRATVMSLLSQDYPAPVEVILVGDVGDSTWTALADIADPRLVILEQEKTPGQRDPNVKRHSGLLEARGDLLALADSDIVMDPDWLAKGVALLLDQGGGAVAGGMRAIHPQRFWPRFVDRNMLAAKTSRIASPYRVTAGDFGMRKAPLTANVIFTRDLYEQTPLDPAWSYGYEDYEWMWRVVKDGHNVLMHDALTGAHHHREKFSQLVREYRRSAHGCAQFVRRHPDSPLAEKRKAQAILLPLAAVVAAAAAGVGVGLGFPFAVAGLVAVALLALGVREVIRSRSLEAATYPAAGLTLGGVFAASLAGNLLRSGREQAVSKWAPVHGDVRKSRKACVRHWPLILLLTAQGVVSGLLIFTNSVFGDEATYLWAGHAERAGMTGPPSGSLFSSYFSGAPQIYPLLSSVLPNLTAARFASLAMMLTITVLVWYVARKVTGSSMGAYAAAAAWALSEPVLRMGAFATYDPLAIFLICVSMWLGIEAAYRHRRGELILASSVCFAAGALTAYSYLLYMPVFVALTYSVHAMRKGWHTGIVVAGWQAIAAALIFFLSGTALKIWHGFLYTTVSRSMSDQQSFGSVVDMVWGFAGLVLIASVVTAILAPRSLRIFALCGVLGAFLVPVYQAFDARTGWSMDKHMAPGMFCAALVIAAGCANTKVGGKQIVWLVGACAVLLAACAPQAVSTQLIWPNSSSLAAALKPLASEVKGSAQSNVSANILDYDSLPISLNRLTWSGSLANVPSGSLGSLESSYRKKLEDTTPPLVILAYTGKVPTALLTPAGQGKTADLSSVIGQVSREPGLYALTLALQSDPAYQEVKTGPYDSGWSYGYTPGTYIIWKRVSVPATHHGNKSQRGGRA